jgi:hypothetical protein
LQERGSPRFGVQNHGNSYINPEGWTMSGNGMTDHDFAKHTRALMDAETNSDAYAGVVAMKDELEAARAATAGEFAGPGDLSQIEEGGANRGTLEAPPVSTDPNDVPPPKTVNPADLPE